MKTRHALAASLVCLALAGCSSTSAELRAKPWETDTVHLDLPYDAVYLYFLSNTRQCWDGVGTNASSFHVVGGETAPGKSATVEVIQASFVRRVLLSADIAAVAGGTDVTYYVHPNFGLLHTFRSDITRWANGTGTACG